MSTSVKSYLITNVDLNKLCPNVGVSNFIALNKTKLHKLKLYLQCLKNFVEAHLQQEVGNSIFCTTAREGCRK